MASRLLLFLLLLVFLSKCSRENNSLFRLVPAEESGLNFKNTIEESDSVNILTVEYMYHGAGVAVGDFNNDKLTDILFIGNIVSNRLYLNKGNLKFEDVTVAAGINGGSKWRSGVALADVNNDGWLDIYVCATIKKDSLQRANMLFIHKGLKNGIPYFEDEAHSYGVADMGYSQNAAFLDYDKDGDLDLYVLTNLESDRIPSVYRPRILDGSALNNDRLYRNNNNGTFTNVTREAGILIEGYGLGIAIADINADSWPDIYIGNDYVSNDILYINNKDGTFTNEIEGRIKHQSLFTMGIDIADINNDAFPDIITLDMLPENNLRRKTIAGAGATYYNYINNIEYDYEFQYMRNMLHINNGNGHYSEIGQMAGIHQTEWSWSSLLVDVDNDGYRDLLVTNGFPKDVTYRDYVMFKREVGIFNNKRSLIDSIPVLKVSNYGFKNNGDLTFSDKTSDWGLNRPSFSNGAAIADLDNDGDLDYVVNNINDPAYLYENKLYSGKEKNGHNHFLRIRLEGAEKHNGSAQGAKVTLRYDDCKTQFSEHSIYRGYLSTMEDVVHFGLGQSTSIDTLTIEWPDGRRNVLFHIETDQMLIVKQIEAQTIGIKKPALKSGIFFREVSKQLGVLYKHKEWDKVDFHRQRTLPHKFSQAGPGLAIGDVNGDLREDFIVGGSSNHDISIFKQDMNGNFTHSDLIKTVNRKSEDEGLLLFDADNDHDADLYITSGSYEGEPGEPHYQDRFYLNNGKGEFTLAVDALPKTTASGSCVRAADMDSDGDLDLFVGGRVVPGAYPLPPESYILRNDGGKFVNATREFAPELAVAGMITDGLWSDYDNDGRIDLIIVGEFMAPTFFKNTGTGLKRQRETGLEKFTGWWNSIAAGDFDKDGDTDYIAGNLGQNNFYNISEMQPLRVYAKDFDANESIDAIVSCYFKSEQGEMKEYPVHSWDELYSQSPKFRNQFSSFKQYGRATMNDLLKPYDTTGMIKLEANYPMTSFINNNGDGTFEIKALPKMVQVAPINGIVIEDVDNDGNLDVLMIGNDYGNEVFSGRYDACTGIILLGDGTGNFQYRSSLNSGFLVNGDAKALGKLNSTRGEIFIATQNIDSLRMFKFTATTDKNQDFMPLITDSWAELTFASGKKQKVEFYYGSGYLSQSTRNMKIHAEVTDMVVYDFSRKRRVIKGMGGI
ncbi:MAG: VCBS repeat-containing protein [Cyclobacteriaceae bacterium]